MVAASTALPVEAMGRLRVPVSTSQTTTATPASAANSATCPPGNLERRFEEEFSQHIQKRNRRLGIQLGAVGAGIGGALGVAAASPIVLPGIALAGLLGGAAGGYHIAKMKGRQELQRQQVPGEDGDGSPSAGMDATQQSPPMRRLRYLVKWGHWQLIEYEDAPADWRSAVLDEIVRPFSSSVQKMYLLRAQGMAGEASPEAREVFQHLAPLYCLVQRRVSADAVVESAQTLAATLDGGAVDALCAERCRIIFPTILETISVMDRLSPAMLAQLDEDASRSSRRERRSRLRRLQHIVGALRNVLERPDVKAGLVVSSQGPGVGSASAGDSEEGEESPTAKDADSPASSSSGARRTLVVPPEGAENEHLGQHDDLAYYSFGEESDEGAASRQPSRMACSPSAADMGGDSNQVSGFRARAEAFPRGNADHTWTDFDASNFDVRSSSYLANRAKGPSSAAMLELLNCDFMLVGEDGPIWRVADHPAFYPQQQRQTGDKRFFFVQNWIFPPFQTIITGCVDPKAAWLASGQDGTPQSRLWRRFLEADEAERSDRFKVIVSVEEGPWLARRACPKKPVLLGKKVKTNSYHQPDSHLEIVLDVGSGKALQSGVGIVCGALKRIRLGLAVLVEGREEEELPEQVLISASMLHLDPSRLSCPKVGGGSSSRFA
jgi:hypothetical protein